MQGWGQEGTDHPVATAGTSLHPQTCRGQAEVGSLVGGQGRSAAHLGGYGVAGGHSTAGTGDTSCHMHNLTFWAQNKNAVSSVVQLTQTALGLHRYCSLSWLEAALALQLQ